jgi:hypothetical protein
MASYREHACSMLSLIHFKIKRKGKVEIKRMTYLKT